LGAAQLKIGEKIAAVKILRYGFYGVILPLLYVVKK
jgi:hypothetical protein